VADEMSLVEYAGLPIAALDRHTGTQQAYQDVVSWEIPTGKTGVLFEAAIVTSDTTKTQIRLQIKKSLTGTLTLTNGSAAVSGSGSVFLTELEVGDKIILDDDETWAEILSIESNTALTLTIAYSGTGGSGSGSKVWGFEDKYIQAALSLPWENDKLDAGMEVKWQAKSTDGTSITVDGSITGKTLEYE
jgi:hypothetical protein